MLYPLFFEPIYKNVIWGGRNLERLFNRSLPEGNIGESWEICCHKNGTSIVSQGPLKGYSLKNLIEKYGKELLGSKVSNHSTFPLLIKLIDAKDKLSIQVHPDDKYAMENEGEMGKTEMWYIIDAKEDAKLIYGVKKGVNKYDFKNAITEGKLEEYVNYVNVKKGDVVFIPTGTIHAILEGIVIAEIQQNSDTTYRVYDFNRVDSKGNHRELHIEKALDVINFDFQGTINKPKTIFFDKYSIENIAKCEYFSVDKIKVNEIYEDICNGFTFHAYLSIEGEGELLHNGLSYKIPLGCSFLIPAYAGEYKIKGDITLLKSYL
ncbi:class I mannose-6-phosphate isomerase [Caloramator sp. E03]|uniref:type I phosphomannose isomerase catalytic subunit n=1 Tax=Caloramator sp. E03 TaxID=2576307 RepID=UPI001110BEA9|nr:type I phosphomannose isomerase catalytic subunit [Caloramator sp. E03]QCX32948.1 class I mannose-6-phosphate isomerase [Caloramator sp. E03]